MNITLVFFIYGLAFYSMGMAMLFESGRSPILVERHILVPLAVFGLVHGFHEWLEMLLERSGFILVNNPAFWGWFRLIVLSLSFAALLIFGLQVLYADQGSKLNRRLIWIAGITGYVVVFLAVIILVSLDKPTPLSDYDAIIRYVLAVPGAAVAGLALFSQAVRARRFSYQHLDTALLVAFVGFAVYALTQLFVPPASFFPANMINTASFQTLSGFPIQIIRAGMAILIALGLIKAVHINEKERQRQFLLVEQERLEALERIEIELKEREIMRKELLRHIVQAQEEERARISRELHDETSQTLAAFTFHLAALRSLLPKDTQESSQLDHLRSLSKRMATGIYRLVRDLRPLHLDDLGLVPALEYLAEEAYKQMGLRVDLLVVGEPRRLEPYIETSLYRIAQEGLTNTARHSGVNNAKVQITYKDDLVVLELSDQGKGFFIDQIDGSGWGLAGIRERAESIGGGIAILSEPELGTRLEVNVRTG